MKFYYYESNRIIDVIDWNREVLKITKISLIVVKKNISNVEKKVETYMYS